MYKVADFTHLQCKSLWVCGLGGGHSTGMTTENPLWVGAWWIGFLAGGAAALLVAFPILGYPRQLPGNCAVPFK